MKRYQCHKIVEAAKVIGHTTTLDEARTYSTLYGDDGGEYEMPTARISGGNGVGGYVVRYEDGYLSWSPAKAFEEGYTLIGMRP
jgi:hypothetical protein